MGNMYEREKLSLPPLRATSTPFSFVKYSLGRSDNRTEFRSNNDIEQRRDNADNADNARARYRISINAAAQHRICVNGPIIN